MSSVRKIQKIILIWIILSFVLTGCWNYREINEVEVVIGFAVDKDDKSNQYLLTNEYIVAESKKQVASMKSKIIQNEGPTLFTTVRGFVESTGNISYWAHTKIIVIGQELAKEGIIPILDYTMRDAEFRPDTKLLISDEKTASEIFTTQMPEIPIKSLRLEDSLKYQNKVGTFESVDIWNFIDKLSRKGYCPVAPLVSLEKQEKTTVLRISGLAIFKDAKMIGKLNGEETKYYLFIDNEIKNQLLVVKYRKGKQVINITLEILSNKTEVKPKKIGNNLTIQINVKCNVDFAEIDSTTNVIKKEERKKVEKATEEEIKKNIEKLIKRVQTEYNTDIFGFGDKIKNDMPKVWEKVKDNWDYEFRHLNIEVQPKVIIEKSALTSKTIEMDAY